MLTRIHCSSHHYDLLRTTGYTRQTAAHRLTQLPAPVCITLTTSNVCFHILTGFVFVGGIWTDLFHNLLKFSIFLPSSCFWNLSAMLNVSVVHSFILLGNIPLLGYNSVYLIHLLRDLGIFQLWQLWTESTQTECEFVCTSVWGLEWNACNVLWLWSVLTLGLQRSRILL